MILKVLVWIQSAILGALAKDGGLEGMTAGKPSEAALLMSGLPGPVTAAVSRHLTLSGIERERVIFCDYF